VQFLPQETAQFTFQVLVDCLSPTGWQCEVTSLSSLWHPCHATITSKSLHPNHTKFPVPPIIFSTLFMSMSPTFPSRTLIHEQRPSLSAFLTNRPAAGAGEPAGSLPVAMPAGASWIFFMPTSPAKKNVCIVVAWPGLDWTKLVEQQGWCHRHTSSSHLLLNTSHKLTSNQKIFLACVVDQISQLVFGHQSLVPTSTSSQLLATACTCRDSLCLYSRQEEAVWPLGETVLHVM